MNFYIWEGDYTSAYGQDAVLVVMATSLGEARDYLKQYLAGAPVMKKTAHEAPGNPIDAYQRWLAEEYDPVRDYNRRMIDAYTARHGVVATRGLEPSRYEGDCYDWNWEKILAVTPREVPAKPGIVFAHYGYEG